MDDVAFPGWSRSSNANGGYSYRYHITWTPIHRMVTRTSTGQWVVYEWIESLSGSDWKALDMTFEDPTAAMAWATVEMSNG